MDIAAFPAWAYYPKFLAYHEIKDPLLVITDFFGTDLPKGYRQHLKMWKSYAVSKEQYTNEYEGANALVFRYQENVKLVEALYLLLIRYNSQFANNKQFAEDHLHEEKEKWKYFPKYLSREELVNPFYAIKKVFAKISLPEHRELLYELLTEGLSVGDNFRQDFKKDAKKLYRQQVKLYEAAWIIKQRLTAYPHFKKPGDDAKEKS